MTRLLLVRHGETKLNAQKRFQGRLDEPLNQHGQLQAQALGNHLAQETIDLVFCSDLLRAHETALAIISGRNLALSLDVGLREMNFGIWEGLTYSEIEQQAPEKIAEWQENMMETAPPGGESLGQFADRIDKSMTIITHGYPDKNILLVAHGGVLQVILCQALGLSPEKYWQFHISLASLSEIYLFPKYTTLNLLNDTCHLEKIKWDN